MTFTTHELSVLHHAIITAKSAWRKDAERETDPQRHSQLLTRISEVAELQRQLITMEFTMNSDLPSQ
jgi:hypothetical protein